MEKTAINELDARYRDALRHILIGGGVASLAGGAYGLLSPQSPSPRPTRLRIPTAPPVIKLPSKKDEEEAVKAAGLFGLAKRASVVDSVSNAAGTVSGAMAAGDKAIGNVVNPALGTAVEAVPDVLKSDVKAPEFSVLGFPALVAALGGGAMLGHGMGSKVRANLDRSSSRSRLAAAKKDYEDAIAAQLGKTASDDSIEFGDLYEKASQQDGIMSKLLPAAWQTPGGGRLEGEAGQNLRQFTDLLPATGLAAAVPMGLGMYSLMKSYGMAHGRKKLVQRMLDEEARRRLARNAPKVTVELDG